VATAPDNVRVFNAARPSAGASTRRYNGLVTTLSENEERLVEALRALPPDAADQVIAWTTQLRDLADGRGVDWSDTWSDEDLADARRASLSSFDERERKEA
jgi:hypothetical protein